MKRRNAYDKTRHKKKIFLNVSLSPLKATINYDVQRYGTRNIATLRQDNTLTTARIVLSHSETLPREKVDRNIIVKQKKL